jgi:protoporphyrinogen oxidase
MYNYVDEDSEIFIKKESNLSVFYIENMQRINPKINKEIISHNTFFNYYSQPIYDKIFIKNKPNFITPLKNFYIANLDMTYPFDRGTNYAIKIGKKVASFITH